MNIGNIGNAYHTHTLAQALQTTQAPSNAHQQPTTINFGQPGQSTASQQNKSTLDSLGKGSLL